jgi:aminopeptidase N
VLTIDYEIVAPKNPLNGYRTFGEIDGILALPNAYALIPPRDTNGFWRLDVAPNFGDVVFAETALFLARITAPRDVVVVASAVCDESNASAEVASSVKTMTCVAAPARDFALHISRAYQVRRVRATSAYGGSIVVSSFFTPPETRSASNALIFAADAVKTFEKHFGAYPYRELKIFQATTGVGGIEYPISVGITSFSKLRDNDYFEWLVAHEVAHQWWYGMVGSDPVNEAWLDEGLAQYSTSLYIEARHGVVAADRLRERFFTQRWALEKRERGDAKAGKPTMAFNRWAYAPTIYGKSPLFFDQARREGGDALFFAWLKRYFENHRFDIARGENLLAAADQVGNGETARRSHEQWILEDR